MPKYRVVLRGISDSTKEGKRAFLKKFAKDAQITRPKAAEIIKESKGALYTFDDIISAEQAVSFLEQIGGIAKVEVIESPPWDPPPNWRLNRLARQCGDDPIRIIGGATYAGAAGFKGDVLFLPCKVPRRPRRDVGPLLLLWFLIALTINIFFPPHILSIIVQSILFLVLVLFPFLESFKKVKKTIYLYPEYIAWVACRGPIITIKFKRGVESAGKLRKIKIFVSPEGREGFFQTFEREYSGFLPKEYRLALVVGEMRQGQNWEIINKTYAVEEKKRILTIIFGKVLAVSTTAALVLGIVAIGYTYVGYSRLSLESKKQESLASIENKIAALQIELDAAREQPYPSAIVLKGGRKICCEILAEEQDTLRVVSARGPIEINRDDTVSVFHSARDQETNRLEFEIERLQAKKKKIE